MKKLIPFFFIFLLIIIFFWQFLFKGLIPIPSDTIIGLYHPFRDFYEKNYPNGIPFKNFLITDPVRQQYPWRDLAISLEKKTELPLWNPYNFAGTPLLANFQSAAFYPLNILFFIFSLPVAWGFLILLEPLFASMFFYLYLRNIKLNQVSSFFGAVIFGFSGFSIAWLEWGTVMHVALWLPLLLLSIDKIIMSKKYFLWTVVFIFSLSSSFLAGHLQTFFYVSIVSLIYFFIRWIQFGKEKKIFFIFLASAVLFLVITSVQWIPTFQFLSESARSVDQLQWQKEGWFIPWQNLIQFLIPDFFGNPTTLNYWGVWNYGEFIGYIGIPPLTLAIFAMFFRHDKKTLFFGSIFFLALIFSLPTFLAKTPFILKIPLLSTAQPTRLLFLADFSLAVLAALGMEILMRKGKMIIYPLLFIVFIFISLWCFVIWGGNSFDLISPENLLVAKRNMFFPTVILLAFVFIITTLILNKNKRIASLLLVAIIMITIFDLFRFGLKFTPFTKSDYLFPKTKSLSFLQQNAKNYRVMTSDPRILPPNFSLIYKLQSVNGYDPLYLMRYGELIAASERGIPNISTPFGFNRIINPQNFNSEIIDLLGVKYILSLSDLKDKKLIKVFQEGKTRIYENKNVFPRVFFVKKIHYVNNKVEAITALFNKNIDFRNEVIIENWPDSIKKLPLSFSQGEAEIVEYSPNKIIIKTQNEGEGFLLLTDNYYSNWRAKISSGSSMSESKIYRVDFNFRGIIVPKGEYTVEFYVGLI